ncbi:hypothetical protein L1987_87476 [Smallanthus sonchifolius]|nr:hypothetical protein L1987_87476 [Smallanthus sonchifolius]
MRWDWKLSRVLDKANQNLKYVAVPAKSSSSTGPSAPRGHGTPVSLGLSDDTDPALLSTEDVVELASESDTDVRPLSRKRRPPPSDMLTPEGSGFKLRLRSASKSS